VTMLNEPRLFQIEEQDIGRWYALLQQMLDALFGKHTFPAAANTTDGDDLTQWQISDQGCQLFTWYSGIAFPLPMQVLPGDDGFYGIRDHEFIPGIRKYTS